MCSLEIRVEYWRNIIQRYFVAAQSAIRLEPSGREANERAIQGAVSNTEPLLAELRELVYHSPSALHVPCMILVQIYAAFFPSADLKWLNNAAQMVKTATIYRWRLERRSDVAIPETIVGALTDLDVFYRQDVDVDLQIAETARIRRLCIVDGRDRREVYWNGNLLDIDWTRHKRAWTLFTALVEAAKTSGQGVDTFSELGISLKDARADLSRMLPRKLADWVTIKNQVHRLTLDPLDIGFLRFCTRDVLNEVK